MAETDSSALAGEDPGSPGSLREQLAAVYDEHAPRLYRYALMIVANRADAEDALHQVFAKLAAMGRRIGEVASRNGYLRAAVRNECYRILKHSTRAGGSNPFPGSMLEPADTSGGDEDKREELEDALRRLPPEQREVVHMKVYEQMTFDQIAQAVGASANTVASRYRYAMAKLRERLAGRVQ